MKQSEFLKSVATLTPYQIRKLDTYVLDALKLNEEDKNTDLTSVHIVKNILP